jgi:hypothetical protein
MRISCQVCGDTGWVCEAHADRPWTGPNACDCGEPGMPCELCNPAGAIEEPPPKSPFTGIKPVDLVVFDGILRGRGREADCRVSAKRHISMSGTVAYSRYHVEHWPDDLPDGAYRLTVNGQNIPVRLQARKWFAVA